MTSTPSKKRIFRRLKTFQCTGFGECTMVFSRSEHLARHIRKHTGEKPFKCEYPDCFKSFSRFDNMRQHIQTHEKQRKRKFIGDKDLKTRPLTPAPLLASSDDDDEDEILKRSPSAYATASKDHSGMVSPVSFNGSYFDDAKKHITPIVPQPLSDLQRLTQDELDVLDALNQFRQRPPLPPTSTSNF
ncbi:hypothetical protein DM01DRAFT_1406790 [Hesseltinella vesiculosa]|uniref:C2H2-type domain-containing protein n=1 Tax=Hesseltinella vesiculosa TaxID=101127 RepID=A0A1X2GK06_9FUNG|nr:hypothetical protein DM01DRAFT_1406790 [Hesseltinella vesiculosa]